jgi:hypothetical protein
MASKGRNTVLFRVGDAHGLRETAESKVEEFLHHLIADYACPGLRGTANELCSPPRLGMCLRIEGIGEDVRIEEESIVHSSRPECRDPWSAHGGDVASARPLPHHLQLVRHTAPAIPGRPRSASCAALALPAVPARSSSLPRSGLCFSYGHSVHYYSVPGKSLFLPAYCSLGGQAWENPENRFTIFSARRVPSCTAN